MIRNIITAHALSEDMKIKLESVIKESEKTNSKNQIDIN